MGQRDGVRVGGRSWFHIFLQTCQKPSLGLGLLLAPVSKPPSTWAYIHLVDLALMLWLLFHLLKNWFLILTQGYAFIELGREGNREWGWERERDNHQCETETSICCLSMCPNKGSNLQPFWYVRWSSNQLSQGYFTIKKKNSKQNSHQMHLKHFKLCS